VPENDAITERLRSIEATLLRIENQRLASIEEQVQKINGRVSEAEKWQAATDPIIESMNERIGENCDKIERVETKAIGMLASHQTYIDEQKGSMSGRQRDLAQLGTLLAVVAAAIKIVFFFHP